MKTVFMGTPWFAVAVLEQLVADGYEVAAVYTRPDHESGRGRVLVPSPVKKKAVEYGLPVEQPENFRDPAVAGKLAAYRPDLVLVFSYGRLLPQPVLDVPPLGCINIHPSLLPRHRGASPVISAILAGDAFTGVSIFRMTEKLDAGDILVQAQVPVMDYDTAGMLTGKLALISARLVTEVLSRLAAGETLSRPQDESMASYTSRLSKADGEIDWNLPAVDIWRRVRAFNPWPGCYTRWKGKQLKILAAMPQPGDTNIVPGSIIPRHDSGILCIGTGKGVLGVTGVQLEGRKAMQAGDFYRGQREIAGQLLPS